MLFEVLIPQLPGKRGDAFYSSTGWFGEVTVALAFYILSASYSPSCPFMVSFLFRSRCCS